MGAAWFDFIICLLLGFFGVHRFRLGQVGLGIAYIFTFGLFGIGWIYDILRYFFAAVGGRRIVGARGVLHFYTTPAEPSVIVVERPVVVSVESSRPKSASKPKPKAASKPKPRTAAKSQKPSAQAPLSGLVLNANEELLYSGTASFVSSWQGAAGNPQVQGTLYPGMLAVTNQRIIFTGAEGTLDRPLSELTSATSLFDGLSLQFGERSYPFQTTEGAAVNDAIDAALNS